MSMKCLVPSTLLVIALAWPVTGHSAPPNLCAAGKIKCATKFAVALLKCHEKAEQTGQDTSFDPRFVACRQKASDQLVNAGEPSKGCFEKLETKYGAGCLTTDDVSTVASEIEFLVVAGSVAAVDPNYPNPVVAPCAAGKKKCISKYLKDLLTCHAKGTKPPGLSASDLAVCLQKGDDKFDGGTVPSKGCFEKLETKYGAGCPTHDDAENVGTTDRYVANYVACQLHGASCLTTPTPTATTTPTPTQTVTPRPTHTPPFSETAQYGDTSGGAYCVPQCPTNEGLIGFDGEADALHITRLTGHCGAHGSVTIPPSTVQTVPINPTGSTSSCGPALGNTPFSVDCPTNELVVGFEGRTDGSFVNQLTFHCAKVLVDTNSMSPSYLATGVQPTGTIGPVGPSTGSPFSPTNCPSAPPGMPGGSIGVGAVTWEAGGIQGFGLVCEDIPAHAGCS